MKRARIYFKDATFRICSYDKTEGGFWCKSDYIIFLEELCSDEMLGQKVLEALNRPQIILPHPRSPADWNDINKG